MRARWVVALLVAAVTCVAAVPGAGAATRYRTCYRAHITIIKAKRSISCSRAVRVARHGVHVDGDDGATFRLFGKRWQCLTIARPDRGRHSLLGCFSPPSQRRFHDRAIVTLLLKKHAD